MLRSVSTSRTLGCVKVFCCTAISMIIIIIIFIIVLFIIIMIILCIMFIMFIICIVFIVFIIIITKPRIIIVLIRFQFPRKQGPAGESARDVDELEPRSQPLDGNPRATERVDHERLQHQHQNPGGK
jgi:hypothetical protein